MKRLVPVFLIFLLTSCSSPYDKEQVTEYFREINELNQILMDHEEQLKNNGGLKDFIISTIEMVEEELKRKV